MMISNVLFNVRMDVYSFGNMMVWVNPTNKYAREQVLATPHKRDKRIHIFLTNTHVIKDSHFKEFLEAWFQTPNEEPVITIHLPKNMVDYKKLILEKFIPTLKTAYVPRIRVYCECGPIEFKIRSGYEGYLTFTWETTQLSVSYQIDTYRIYGYATNTNGAIQNKIQAEHPDLFREKILENFKSNCPEGILNSFKSDEDIWNYITQNGEWKEI